MMLSPTDAAQRLQTAQQYFAMAANGDLPLRNTLIAMDGLPDRIKPADR